jgi:hypothetical protein
MADLFNALPAGILGGNVDTPHVVEAVGAIKAAENVHEAAPDKASMRRAGCLRRGRGWGKEVGRRGSGEQKLNKRPGKTEKAVKGSTGSSPSWGSISCHTPLSRRHR